MTLTDPTLGEERRLLPAVLLLLSLVLLVWGITTQAHLGTSGQHLVALVLLVVAVLGWVGWMLARFQALPGLSAATVVVMGLAGGALVPFASVAVVFVGVATLRAALAWAPTPAGWLAAAGPVAMTVSVPAAGHGFEIVYVGWAATVAGFALGVSRRQALERAEQAALVVVTEARAEAERARAELMAGRNHLARELHDVLSHTLSALSLQLEAFDTTARAGSPLSAQARQQLDATKALVREGLDEARGAVRALREDRPPLPEQLSRLADERQAYLQVTGSPRPLPPPVSLALFRVAQEALTNVVKHAPGAQARIHLGFTDQRVTLSVANDCGQDPGGSSLSGSGGGYGLQGIRERVLLLGGHVETGTVDGRWLVDVEVPA